MTTQSYPNDAFTVIPVPRHRLPVRLSYALRGSHGQYQLRGGIGLLSNDVRESFTLPAISWADR